MAKDTDFETGTVVSATWLDAIQEVMSALALGVRLERASSTQYRLPVADDGNDSVTGQSSIILNGKRRWWTAAITKTMSGGAGTYNVYVVAGSGPTLTASEVSHSTGAGPANSRKIGEVVWTGSAITTVRSTVDSVSGHGYQHRPSGNDPLPTAAAVGLSASSTNTEGDDETYARSDHTHAIDVSTFLPAGVISMWPAAAAPSGWLLCQGQSLLRADYAALFAAIGTTYGAADGTHFNLPDLQDRFIVGKSGTKALASTGGAATVTLTKEQSGLPAHGHSVTDPGHQHTVSGGTDSAGDHAHSMSGVSLETTMYTAHNSNNNYQLTGGGTAVASLTSGTRSFSGGAWSGAMGTTGAHTHAVAGVALTTTTGLTVVSHAGANAASAHENLPPYMALNYIIKSS